MSNVASRTYKKRGLYSFGAQFAPPTAFEMHRWHLPLRLGVTTGKTTTSDPKALPKRLALGETAWPGELKDTVFRPALENDLQCQTLRPEPIKKRPSKCTVGTFRCVWASRRAKPRLLTQKPSQKGSPRNGETAWPGELKDTVFRPALE